MQKTPSSAKSSFCTRNQVQYIKKFSAQTTHHINKGFWCVDYTRSYRTFFREKGWGIRSIFWFRWRKMAFSRVFFLPFAIFFFGSTAFHIPFLDSTSAPLTAGELLNRWVLRGLAGLWLGSFVNKKCSRNEVKLSLAVELFYRFGSICSSVRFLFCVAPWHILIRNPTSS